MYEACARGGDREHEHQRELASPGGRRGSGTGASTAGRPGTFPAPFLITLVTAVMRACGTVPAALVPIWQGVQTRHQTGRQAAPAANAAAAASGHAALSQLLPKRACGPALPAAAGSGGYS
jgi:hypothetical protein